MRPRLARLGRAAALAAIAIASAATVLCCYWLARGQGLDESREQVLLEVVRLEQQIRTLEVVAPQLEAFNREFDLVEARLETLRLIVPEKAATDALVASLRTLAGRQGIALSATPVAPQTVSRNFYQEVALEVGIRGRPQRIAGFLQGVGRIPRLVLVRRVELEADGPRELAGRLSLATFVWVKKPSPR
jgi:Tfp pilus assembly protein PilO